MTLLSRNKITGNITLLSGFLAFACMLTAAYGVNFHMEVFNNPVQMLTLPGVNANASRWSMTFDMLGYYVLLLPVVIYFRDWMNQFTPWSNLISICGIAYILIGAAGASILAVVYPQTLTAYPIASPEIKQIIRIIFEVVNNIVYDGLWNLLEMLFGGAWWLLTGLYLFQSGRKALGGTTVILGLTCLLDGFSGIFQISTLHDIALNVYLWLAIIWAMWTGTSLIRDPLK